MIITGLLGGGRDVVRGGFVECGRFGGRRGYGGATRVHVLRAVSDGGGLLCGYRHGRPHRGGFRHRRRRRHRLRPRGGRGRRRCCCGGGRQTFACARLDGRFRWWFRTAYRYYWRFCRDDCGGRRRRGRLG